MQCEVSLLGSVRGVRAGNDVDLGPARQRSLFAVLAMRAGSVVSRQELVAGVWGDTAPVTVANSVYTYVARLRRVLEPDRGPRAHPRLLVQEGAGYRLQIAPKAIDSNRFRHHLQRAYAHQRAGGVGHAVDEFDRALRLWHGPALAGVSGPYIDAERNRLEEQRFTAVEERLHCLLRIGQVEDVLGELATLAHTYPLRERTRCLLMLALYGTGRKAEALAEYRDIRTRLRDGLGIEPGAELQQAHEQILREEDPRELHLSRSDTVRLAGDCAAPPAQLPHDVAPFTGREAELVHLREVLTAAEACGEAPILLIHGAAGMGKTALAVRFAHSVAGRFDSGQLFLDMGGVKPMPGPEAGALVLDSLGIRPPRTRRGGEGFYRSALAGRRLLLLLDDVRTAEQVRPLLPGAPGCVVVVTTRYRLSGLTARNGAAPMMLTPLAFDHALTLMRELVVRAGGEPPAEGSLRPLVRACGQLPQTVRAAAERLAALGPDSARQAIAGAGLLDWLDSAGDPTTAVRSMLATTFAQLPRRAVPLLLAIADGHSTWVDTASAARLRGMCQSEALGRLADLARVGLLLDLGQGNYELPAYVREYLRERGSAGQSTRSSGT